MNAWWEKENNEKKQHIHTHTHSDITLILCKQQERMVFGFLRDIVSFHVVVNFSFVTFFVEDARFLFIRWVCWLRTPRCSSSHFGLACHGPLLMNNYYSKYLVYIVHLHGLFNYAIRILINPNSFLLFVGHRSIHPAEVESTKKYGWNESNENFNDFAHKGFNRSVINWISIEL